MKKEVIIISAMITGSLSANQLNIPIPEKNYNIDISDYYPNKQLLTLKFVESKDITKKIKTRLNKLVDYYRFSLNKKVISFLLDISSDFKYYPQIAPLFENYIQLEYDMGNNCLDFEILYEGKIIINMLKLINGKDIETYDISKKIMIKEINEFNKVS